MQTKLLKKGLNKNHSSRPKSKKIFEKFKANMVEMLPSEFATTTQN